jgi:hypothetical protein
MYIEADNMLLIYRRLALDHNADEAIPR